MSLSLVANLADRMQPLAKSALAPQSLAKLATIVPFRVNALLIQSMLNKVFSEQMEDGDFEHLLNRSLQVEIIDARLYMSLGFDGQQILCQHFCKQAVAADATLSVMSSDAIDLIRQEVDPDTLFFQRKLKIAGDTELAHHIKNTIDTINPATIPQSILRLLMGYQTLLQS